MDLYKNIKLKLKESTDNAEWIYVCRAFCRKIGAKLLFVNDDNFGYETKDGQLVHMYADELEQYLKSGKLKEADTVKNDTEQAYMNYVKEWFDDRDFSWQDELSYWSNKQDNWDIEDYKKLFDGLYEENGINGELFVSYDEWLDNEYDLEESQKLKEAGNLKRTWSLSYDEKKRMYDFIAQVYGKNYVERVIDNINTVTDEKITRLYDSALKKFKSKQKSDSKLTGEPVVKDKDYDIEERD